jgi:hypothetical protein
MGKDFHGDTDRESRSANPSGWGPGGNHGGFPRTWFPSSHGIARHGRPQPHALLLFLAIASTMSIKQITSHNQFMSIVGIFIAISMTAQLTAVTVLAYVASQSDDGRGQDSLRRLRL